MPASDTVEVVRRPLVLLTTGYADWLMQHFGYDPRVVKGLNLGYENAFMFPPLTDCAAPRVTGVVLACTGLGSIGIFTGLVAAVDAPARRKLAGAAVVVPVIYALNVVRVTFIVLANGLAWFSDQTWVLMVPGSSEAGKMSYYVADRIISQGLPVVVLVAIALVLLRLVPEVVVVFEDVLYLVTGDEYDLHDPVGTEVRVDGSGE